MQLCLLCVCVVCRISRSQWWRQIHVVQLQSEVAQRTSYMLQSIYNVDILSINTMSVSVQFAHDFHVCASRETDLVALTEVSSVPFDTLYLRMSRLLNPLRFVICAIELYA